MEKKFITLISFLFLLVILCGCSFVPADGSYDSNRCEDGYILEGNECIEIIDVNDEPVHQEDDSIDIYFQKPNSWDGVRIFYYDASNGDYVSWNTSPDMIPWSDQNGWYVYRFNEEITSVKVMFRDDGINQLPTKGLQGHIIERDTWFYNDYYTNTFNNPFE